MKDTFEHEFTIDWARVRELHALGMSYPQIAREIGCAASSVGRIVNDPRALAESFKGDKWLVDRIVELHGRGASELVARPKITVRPPWA